MLISFFFFFATATRSCVRVFTANPLSKGSPSSHDLSLFMGVSQPCLCLFVVVFGRLFKFVVMRIESSALMRYVMQTGHTCGSFGSMDQTNPQFVGKEPRLSHGETEKHQHSQTGHTCGSFGSMDQTNPQFVGKEPRLFHSDTKKAATFVHV